MTFTVENQKGNNITRTTSQTVRHILYGNNEVSVCGMDNVHTVWHKQGSSISRINDGLNLNDALSFANNFIKNI
tara:strand:+ start:332 stop:553 length:222 start_codon:yes stop_codon:yes gene_type:complete